MNLYLMRHTEPVHGHPLDASRPLKDSGTKQAADMAAWLTKLIGRVDIVISSPFVRAMQTAAIMADALGSYVADTRMLGPEGTPDEMWAEIERLAQQSKDVLIVGHDPSLNKLIFSLMGIEGDQSDLRLDWGAVAFMKIKTGETGLLQFGTLQWLFTPLLLPPPEEQELLESAKQLAGVLA